MAKRVNCTRTNSYTFSRESFGKPSKRIHMNKLWNTKDDIKKYREKDLIGLKHIKARIIKVPKGYKFDLKKVKWLKCKK